MVPVGTLWGLTRQAQTKIILSVAAVKGLQLELREIDFSNKSTAFTSTFSYAKIPAFEGSDGFKLTEGLSIARYLSGLGTEVNLLGSDAKEIALVDQWTHFAESEVIRVGLGLAGLIYGFSRPFSRESLDRLTEQLVCALEHVEAHLKAGTTAYLVSNSVTLADFALAAGVHLAGCLSFGTAEREQYPATFSHYAKVTSDARVNKYWITEKFIDVRITEPKTDKHS